MDSDYERVNRIDNITPPRHTPPPRPQPPTPEPVVEEPRSRSSIPYLAKLAAFSIVFLSVLYSLVTLISYLVEKLLVKQAENNYDYSYISGIDSFLVISAVATLIVAVPASAILLFCLRRAENIESWRVSQKWRRIIYTIVQVILVISVISTLIGTIYNVLSLTLDLEVNSSYYGVGSDEKKPADNGSKIASAVISGIAAVVIYVLTIVAFVGEYAAKWRQVTWGILLLFAIVGAIVGGTSVVKVQEQIKKEKSSEQKYDPYSNPYSSSSSSSSSSSDPDASSSYSSEKGTLTSIKGDLSYYASSNGGKYPTKAQWDDGSLKPKYLLSSDETLKKVTYAPTGCDATGCTGYTISMKDKDGKTVSLDSTSSSE